MTKLYGIMVVKDEESRYLESCLEELKFLDNIYVYDDRSTDESVNIASDFGAIVDIRPEDEPAFLQNESAFRKSCWEKFVDTFNPSEDDWILAIDADEFLNTGPDSPKDKLLSLAEDPDVTYAFKRHEVFKIVANKAYKRVDGYWDSIFGPRFFRFKSDFEWPSGTLGCGSLPRYAMKKEIRVRHDVSIMHLGYVKEMDRKEKFDRYIKRPGHNLDHIKSILAKPQLEPTSWHVPYSVWRYMDD